MEGETQIDFLLTIGILAMFFIASLLASIFAIYRSRILRSEKEKQIIYFKASFEGEERQKVKIAGDLHDHIIPILLQKVRNSQNLLSEFHHHGGSLDRLKEEIESLMELSNDIQAIAHDLIPKLFISFGLLKSIEVFVKSLKNSESATNFYNNTNFTTELPFSQNDQLTIYRISLEVLNNISKHSKYDFLNVSVDHSENKLILLFSHDGKGITNEQIFKLRESSQGIGLKSMQSRMLLLGAAIDYYLDSGVSYVKLVVPINERDN